MENNTVNNSCLMLACALYTPVTLGCIFDETHLEGNGIELETHITLLYAAGTTISRADILPDIDTILGDTDTQDFLDILKGSDLIDNILDHFELSLFENDSDYLVLKLRPENPVFDSLVLINKGLRTKYNISADYTYTPHITLAQLKAGTGREYFESDVIRKVLENSRIGFEDLVVSFGPSGIPENRDRYNLTTYHAVSRYFREAELKTNVI